MLKSLMEFGAIKGIKITVFLKDVHLSRFSRVESIITPVLVPYEEQNKPKILNKDFTSYLRLIRCNTR